MSKIDTEISQEERAQVNRAHIKRLADAMMPDPKEWEYSGEILEDDSGSAHCACGHPIRYLFPIERKRDGASLIIGSVCIETSIPFLTTHGAEGLAEALNKGNERLAEMIKERQKRIRENQGNDRYAFLETYATDLHEWIKTTLTAVRERSRDRGWRMPFLAEYFYKGEYRVLIAEPTATTPGRAAASLEKRILTGLQYAELLFKQLAEGSYRDVAAFMPFDLKQFQTTMETFKSSQKGKTRKAAPPTAERAETEPESSEKATGGEEESPMEITEDDMALVECLAEMDAETEEPAQKPILVVEVSEDYEILATLEQHSRAQEAEEAEESEELRDPNDLTGRTYTPTAGPFLGTVITIMKKADPEGRYWTVHAPDGKEWPVGRAALERALGLA